MKTEEQALVDQVTATVEQAAELIERVPFEIKRCIVAGAGLSLLWFQRIR